MSDKRNGIGISYLWMESRKHWLTPCADDHDDSYELMYRGEAAIPDLIALRKRFVTDPEADEGRWYERWTEDDFARYTTELKRRCAQGETQKEVDDRFFRDAVSASKHLSIFKRSLPYLFYPIIVAWGKLRWRN